jgi:hypothetical protein
MTLKARSIRGARKGFGRASLRCAGFSRQTAFLRFQHLHSNRKPLSYAEEVGDKARPLPPQVETLSNALEAARPESADTMSSRLLIGPASSQPRTAQSLFRHLR